MFGSQILEVAIGIMFVFFLVSIISSAIREGIESFLKTRAAYLERGIKELFDAKEGDDFVKDFYSHPLINCLFTRKYEPLKDSDGPRIFKVVRISHHIYQQKTLPSH